MDFDAAVLRSVAGVEKKRSILQGIEKEVVARHEVRVGRYCARLVAPSKAPLLNPLNQVGHALVASCAELLLPTQAASVDRLSIIPRSGGALGFTYMPPKTEDRALMFDR